MPDILHSVVQNKKADLSKLAAFGFRQQGSRYVYSRELPGSGFQLTVTCTAQGKLLAEILDPSLNEPYTLHLADGASGNFVGRIKAQYEETLTEISRQCFVPDVFHSRQAGELMNYVKRVYGDELEFLWKKFPDNAIWRRKDTGKWYGALLTVPKRKLGIDADGAVEIIDLRIHPEELSALVDGKTYLPGYHMNKSHWCTIILDGSVSLGELTSRIEKSHSLAVK